MSDTPAVTLSVSPEIVRPIVEQKIKAAILEAFGGTDQVVQSICQQVMDRKVDKDGRVSSYSSDNKYSWFDVVVTQQIRSAIETEVRGQIVNSSAAIKEAVVKELQTKKGANMVAKALLEGLEGTFKNSWTSKLDVKFESKSND